MRHRSRIGVSAALAIAAAGLLAACGSSGSSGSGSGSSGSNSNSGSQVTVGVDLTYNNTAFWAAYINYETQYAKQLHIKLIGPLLAAANASLQNQQIEELVNEGAQAVIVNPETATSLGPAIAYASAHHVKLISVDTIVGVGNVYMVVRASNLIYGLDACAYISSKVKSGYVLDLEGDLTSSNGADRTNAFNDCMAANDPGVKILKDPTVWTESTAVTDAQNAVNAYGSQLKAIYAQWSSPDTGVLPLLKNKGLSGKTIVISDDGVPFEMCDITKGALDAPQSQPANLYAEWALKYAVDNENLANLLLAAKFGIPVCPHAGGVGLCEIVQHLSMFDYVALTGTTQGRMIEWIDHLHEHFEAPATVSRGRYLAPQTPGASTRMHPQPLAEYSFPAGPAWLTTGQPA